MSTSSLDQLVRDLMRRRQNAENDLREAERLMRGTSDKLTQKQNELKRLELEYERTRSRIQTEHDTHERELAILKTKHGELTQQVDEIGRDLDTAERSLAADRMNRGK